MKQHWLIPAILLVMSSPLTADDSLNFVFDASFRGVGNSIIEIPSGGYVAVGYTESGEYGGKDIVLIRLGVEGKTVWKKNFGGAGDDWGWDVRQTSDEGFFVIGFTDTTKKGDKDIILLRIDSNGTLMWEKKYGGDKDEEAWALEVLDDGGTMLVAQTESEGAGAEDVYLIRTNIKGEPVWARVLGGPGADRVFAITATSEGEFAVAGLSRETEDAASDILVIRFASDGKVRWQKTYGGSHDEIGHGIATLPGGDLLITGYGDSSGNGSNNAILMRLSPDGTPRWRKEFGGKEDDRAMMSGICGDGTIVTVGYRQINDEWDAWLFATDTEGGLLWETNLTNPGLDRGIFVLPGSDGSWILTGTMASPESDSNLIVRKFFLPPSPGHSFPCRETHPGE